MARPTKFSTDALLDAAAQAVREHGRAATIAQVAELSGAPVGSIYHRFGSRDELLGELWLRSIHRFHAALHLALGHPEPRTAALSAAVLIPGFCREHPLDATAMTLYSQADLLDRGPESLQARVAVVNDEIFAAFARLAEQLCGGQDSGAPGTAGTGGRGRELVACACVANPYGLVRPYVRAGVDLPDWLEEATAASSGAILDLLVPVLAAEGSAAGGKEYRGGDSNP